MIEAELLRQIFDHEERCDRCQYSSGIHDHRGLAAERNGFKSISPIHIKQNLLMIIENYDQLEYDQV
jgi:hypothetical protein